MSELNPKRRVVRCRARLVLADEDAGGLRQPLRLPTQSVLFKFADGPLIGAGTLAIVDISEREELSAGVEVDADVIFPDAPRDVQFRDTQFTLWNGRDIGAARIVDVLTDPDGPPNTE